MYAKKTKILPNGETLSYIEKGAGDNYLILIHGNSSSSVFFSPFLDRISTKYHVIAPDLRGFGDSSYKSKITTLKEFADDINLLMNELEIKKAAVLGWSLGGGVAMEFAINYPLSTRKLILINSTPYNGYPIFKKDVDGKPLVGEVYETMDEMALDPIQVLPMVNILKNKDFATLEYIYNLTIYTQRKPSKENNEYWLSDALKQRNIVECDWALAVLNLSNTPNSYGLGNGNISKINVQTLITCGEHDIIVPEAFATENYKAIKNSQFIKYSSCGHSPFVDCPDQLTKDIEEFLN